jgi:hypothetical protein
MRGKSPPYRRFGGGATFDNFLKSPTWLPTSAAGRSRPEEKHRCPL